MGNRKHRWSEEELKAIRELYWDKAWTMQRVGQHFGVTKEAILIIMRRKGIPRRSGSEAQSLFFKQNPTWMRARQRSSRLWRGGRTIHTRNGHSYIMVKVDIEDPLFCMTQHSPVKTAGYMPEHRLVMARHLGRPLASKEQVHHKNGDSMDNRLENLELLTASSHSVRTMLCSQCLLRQEIDELKKQVRLLTWQLRELLVTQDDEIVHPDGNIR